MRRRSKTCDVAGKVRAKEATPRGSRDDRLEVRPREAAGRGGGRMQTGEARLDIPRKLQERRRSKRKLARRQRQRQRWNAVCFTKGASDAREGESG